MCKNRQPGGHFRYGPDTKCVKAECADLSIVEVVCLGKKEDIWKQLELVDYVTEKLNIKPEVFGTQKD